MIPKIIHYCWIGKKPLPPLAEKCVNSWRRLMPDYEIKCWNESNYDFRKNAFMDKAYQAKKWGFVPDYARLDIIYNYGGIYLDTDVEVIKSFDELLSYPAFCGFESEHFINLGLGFGAEKGNPVIKTLMHPYETLDFEIHEAILRPAYTLQEICSWPKEEFVASPRVQTQSLVENYNLKQDNTRQSLAGIEVFPMSYFCPKDYLTGKLHCTADTLSIHHYMASWLSKGALFRLRMRHWLSRYGNAALTNALIKIWKKFR